MSGYASTVPAALAAIVAALRGWPGLDGVRVSDGPPVEDTGAQEAIAVGYSPGEDTDAADLTAERAGLAGGRDREVYPVECSLEVWNGDRDMPAARARAYELYAAVGEALAAGPTLGGTVMAVRLAGHRLRQSDTNGGMLARINFTVSVDAFTAR